MATMQFKASTFHVITPRGTAEVAGVVSPPFAMHHTRLGWRLVWLDTGTEAAECLLQSYDDAEQLCKLLARYLTPNRKGFVGSDELGEVLCAFLRARPHTQPLAAPGFYATFIPKPPKAEERHAG
jgi:hypothetical protein